MKYLATLAACAVLALAASNVEAGGYGRSFSVQTNVYAAPPVQQSFAAPACASGLCPQQAQQFQQPLQAPLYQSGGCGQVPQQAFQAPLYQQQQQFAAPAYAQQQFAAPVYSQRAFVPQQQFAAPVYATGGYGVGVGAGFSRVGRVRGVGVGVGVVTPGASVIVQQRGLFGRRSTVIVR